MVRKLDPGEKMSPEDIDGMLEFDPLDTAEKLTGTSYKKSDKVKALGMMLHLSHHEVKDKVLRDRGDTVFSMKLAEYLPIVKDLGFVQVLDVPFQAEHDGKMITEHLLAYWRKGLLLMFDTYCGDGVNGGNLYFNWAPTDPNERVPSSGGYTKDSKGHRIIYGSFDCREALRHHISLLESKGKILEKWVEAPSLWPIHYGDSREIDRIAPNYPEKGKAYDDLKVERLAMLPDDVREAILGGAHEKQE